MTERWWRRREINRQPFTHTQSSPTLSPPSRRVLRPYHCTDTKPAFVPQHGFATRRAAGTVQGIAARQPGSGSPTSPACGCSFRGRPRWGKWGGHTAGAFCMECGQKCQRRREIIPSYAAAQEGVAATSCLHRHTDCMCLQVTKLQEDITNDESDDARSRAVLLLAEVGVCV
jgi:hypothetical protein